MIEDLIDEKGEKFWLLTSTQTDDGIGGREESWTASQKSYRGIKNFLNGYKRIINSANNYSIQCKVYCLNDVPVTESNKIRFADGDYTIMQIDPKNGHHQEIIIGRN